MSRKKILEYIESQGSGVLVARKEISKALNHQLHACENTLQMLRIEGVIQRHKVKTEDGDYQFGINLPEDEIEQYVKQPRRREGSTRGPAKTSGLTAYKRKKGTIMTAKGLRMMFAQLQNDIAKPEDSMMDVAEQAEETERKMIKLHNVMSGL
jgi:hypothetical protein